MTYLGPDGKQYVAVYAGVGGWIAGALPDVRPTSVRWAGRRRGHEGHQEGHRAGDTLYVFGL